MASKPYEYGYDPYEGYDTQRLLQDELNREGAGDGTPNTPGTNLPLTTPPGAPTQPGAGATGYNEYFDRNAGRNPLDVLADAYPEFLGRTAGPGEAALHYGRGSVGYTGGGLRGGVGEIYNSPEAIAYRNRSAASTGGGSTGGGTGGGGTIDYANPYSGGANASINAPHIVQRGNQSILVEHGNERVLQPGDLAAAQNYVTQYARQNPTGFIQPGSPGYDASQATANDFANPYSGGAAASSQAPRVIQRGGQTILTEHGNERILQPNEVADAQNYVRQYAATNPTGFIQPGAPGYDASQATTNEGYPRITGQGTTTTPPPATRTGVGGVNLNPRTATGAAGQFSGFNNDRALAGGDANSIKDAWFRFGQGFNFDPTGHSKQEIEAFLTSQIPAAAAYGLHIDQVRGDQIHITTAENPEGTWVDVVGNAGGQGASPWTWQDQSYLGDTGGGGGGTTGGGGGQYQALFNSLIGGRSPSYASLQALEPDLNRAGFKLVRNASGTGADLQLPTGEIVDVIAGQTGPSGGTSWQWLTGDGGGSTSRNAVSNQYTGGGGGGGGDVGGEDPLTAGLGGSALFQKLMEALLQAIQGQRSPTNQANLQNTLNS